MTKKTIGVDIDDVIAANAPGFVEFSNKRWGTNLTPEDYRENWSEMWKISHEETAERRDVYHNDGVIGTFAPVHGAEGVLRELSNRFRVVVLTARTKALVKETTLWLARHFNGIFDDVHYVGLWDDFQKDSHLRTKAEACKELGIDYLVDDQLKHCLATAELGIPVVLFGDYTWNQIDQLPENITRCGDWATVLEYFDGRG